MSLNRHLSRRWRRRSSAEILFSRRASLLFKGGTIAVTGPVTLAGAPKIFSQVNICPPLMGFAFVWVRSRCWRPECVRHRSCHVVHSCIAAPAATQSNTNRASWRSSRRRPCPMSVTAPSSFPTASSAGLLRPAVPAAPVSSHSPSHRSNSPFVVVLDSPACA